MFNTLPEWLACLETRHPSAIDLGLERVRQVARVLNLDHPGCPVITVGGTNGKGSTVATLTAIYCEAGLRVGTYTSPHIVRFNERICLQGEPVADAALVQAFNALEAARLSTGISLTYFEFTTLAALLVFKQAALDIVILEVGLGGRLDAVNLVDADVAVITSIGIDHVDWLGDTREAIGFEKAGIFRAGKTVICGDTDPPASLMAHARALGCPVRLKGRDFGFSVRPADWDWFDAAQRFESMPLPHLAPDNVATALAAVASAPLVLPPEILRSGAGKARLSGRAERISVNGVEIVLDVAHNPHGAAFFMQQLPTASGTTRAVFAMLADKDLAGTLDACLGRVDEWFPASLMAPRGQPAARISPLMHARGFRVGGTFPQVGAALAVALRQSQAGDRILVFGSFYTVAAARLWLDKHYGYSN